MDSDTVLICGGAGYIGSTLTLRFIKDTNLNVKVFDNLSYGGDSLFPFLNYDKRFQFIKGDIRTFDLDKLLDNVTYVINLIALVGEPICKKYPKEAQEINFESNIKLARTAERKKIKRFVFTSTCSNYGLGTDEMITEDGELQPISLYSETKVNSEKILLNELSALPVTVLRFATAYGMAARIRFDLLLHEFIRDAWTKKEISVFGPKSWRPFVHVDDIARSLVLVIEKSNEIKTKDVFNIGSDNQNFQKLTLAKMVADRTSVSINTATGKIDPRNYKVSFEKAKNELGYQTIHRPPESIDQIVSALEQGLITEKTLFESVNVKNDGV